MPFESTRKKVSQYGDGTSVIGFKMDGHFVYYCKELEIGLASAEVSLPFADAAKLHHDKSKLFREAMISTEVVLRLLENEIDVYTCGIKINGLAAEISTLSYDSSTMIYVNTTQFRFYFPTYISDFDNLKDDLRNLFKFKEDIESIQIKVEKALKQSERQEQQSMSSTMHMLCPQLDPYFTPLRNEAKLSVLPTNVRRFDFGI